MLLHNYHLSPHMKHRGEEALSAGSIKSCSFIGQWNTCLEWQRIAEDVIVLTTGFYTTVWGGLVGGGWFLRGLSWLVLGWGLDRSHPRRSQQVPTLTTRGQTRNRMLSQSDPGTPSHNVHNVLKNHSCQDSVPYSCGPWLKGLVSFVG